MFRPSDERRVQAHFDSILPAPYEAEISMSADRTQMTVRVMDPDDATLPVVQAIWAYETLPSMRGQKQPLDAELDTVGEGFIAACNAYTAAKAGT